MIIQNTFPVLWKYEYTKFPKAPPPVIQNLLSKCSESEFYYYYYVLLWEISFLFTDETQHKMLHGFSSKHYTYTFWVKSIIFPALSILQGYLFLNILILL